MGTVASSPKPDTAAVPAGPSRHVRCIAKRVAVTAVAAPGGGEAAASGGGGGGLEVGPGGGGGGDAVGAGGAGRLLATT